MTGHIDPEELKKAALPAPSGELLPERLKPVRSSLRLSWRRIAMLAAASLLVPAAGLYGHYYWTAGRFLQSTDDAYVQADSTIVAPKVSGYLSQVLVKDNQPVKAGQLLASIDDRDYKTALEQAEADVASAQADIDNVKAALQQQQAVIAQARATVEVDQANLSFAEQDSARYNSLAQTGAGTVQMAQQTLAKRDTTRAALARDNAAGTAAERQVAMLQAQLAKDNAVLLHNKAVRDQAQLNLDYTKIVARSTASSAIAVFASVSSYKPVRSSWPWCH